MMCVIKKALLSNEYLIWQDAYTHLQENYFFLSFLIKEIKFPKNLCCNIS